MPSSLSALDTKSETVDQFALQDNERREILPKNFYFDNETVEYLMHRYVKGACIEVVLRDEVMCHASELIRQIIKAHNLGQIYPGKEESSVMDLFQTAWIQIESALYKYEAFPHCTKCYNPMRPNDSVLFDDYVFEEFLIKKVKFCQRCKVKITVESIYYRGKSRVFNMWCVNPKTTRVITESGVLPMSTIISGKASMVHGIERMVEVKNKISKPVQPTIITTTAYNYRIESSKEHMFMKLFNDGPDWEQVANLQVGDLVALQCGQHIFGNNDDVSDIKLVNSGFSVPKVITGDMAYLFGLYLAEGSYSNNEIFIYNTDIEVIDFLSKNDILNFKYIEPSQNYACSKSFNEFMDKVGFKECHMAQTKKIPDRLLRMSKENIHNLLSGIFDGDGHSSSHNGEVGLTSTSLELINQVRMLLLNIGILSKLYVDPREIREFIKKDGKVYKSDLSGAYMLRLSTIDSLRFYDRIGFRINRKQDNYANLPVPQELAYFIADKFIRLYKKYGSVGHYNQIRKLIKPGYVGKLFSIRKCLEYWSDFSTDSDYRFLKDRIDESLRFKNRVVWLPITSLNESSSELCDIEVDAEDNGYIANGFVSHNSQIARTVILAYIKKENRDRKNSEVFRTHLEHQTIVENSALGRFFNESRELSKYNSEHLKILQALEKLYKEDDRAHEGLISKLVARTALSRATVTDFFRILRSRSHEISDSPVNKEVKSIKSMIEIKHDGRRDSVDGW